jgi:hypothetical protein
VLHAFRRIAAVAVASVSTLTASAVIATAPAAHAAGLTNCVQATRLTACYEDVWVDGVQVRMTFPQAGVPMPVIPHAKQQNFYVVAPQTDTPQGDTPGFPHDHVIEVAPTQNHGAFSVLMHGYFVVCSPEGISTGGCVFAMETIPGDGQIPLAKTVNGHELTSAAAIEAGVDSGLLVLLDTGAVLIGAVGPVH